MVIVEGEIGEKKMCYDEVKIIMVKEIKKCIRIRFIYQTRSVLDFPYSQVRIIHQPASNLRHLPFVFLLSLGHGQ